jgi:hypothetical protein
VAGPWTENTNGSLNPAGHGVRTDPQAGVCRIVVTVSVPPDSGVEDVLVINMLTAMFTFPTTTVFGYVGATPRPAPRARADEGRRDTPTTAAKAAVIAIVVRFQREGALHAAESTRSPLIISSPPHSVAPSHLSTAYCPSYLDPARLVVNNPSREAHRHRGVLIAR